MSPSVLPALSRFTALPTALHTALECHDQTAASLIFGQLQQQQQPEAAALALHLGRPALAAQWAAASHDPLTQAAALLRLGQSQEVLELLATQQKTARTAVLAARASWQLTQFDVHVQAEQARQLARQEGDAGATIAAAALLGETLLGWPGQALRVLAEGLKVAELLATEADPYLLAVLAHVQKHLGGTGKAARTAQKALSRGAPRSPARVVALLALGHTAQAQAEAQQGELSEVWLGPFGVVTLRAPAKKMARLIGE